MPTGLPLLPGPRQAGGPLETLEGCGTPGAASLLSSIQSTAMEGVGGGERGFLSVRPSVDRALRVLGLFELSFLQG